MFPLLYIGALLLSLQNRKREAFTYAREVKQDEKKVVAVVHACNFDTYKRGGVQ